MSQNGKLMPNLDQHSTKLLNLTVLQRINPFVEEILITTAHVTFYELNIDLSQWSHKDVEGSLFVVKRNTQPRFQLIVMNRRHTGLILNAYAEVPPKSKVSSIKSGSPRDDKDQIRDSAPEIRDVFEDFDDDEEEDGYAVHHDIEHDSNRSPIDEEGYEKGLRLEDILADEDHRYGSEEKNYEIKNKEKPLGPPLELEVPLQPPPALPEKLVGDDLLMSNAKRIERAVLEYACNALFLKEKSLELLSAS
ncbi:uncharacterized protein LOC130948758 [Arachis stenosperma]|uniref:uncharacterized protein LOC130948758 n=1 Tax=Arachis stenosperma TaxID=217475 RepID=UPI0025AB797F|nr:uncharacterized protein LOC130948758 [Arachis stenosperma]